jgi:hypothetical protein
VNDSIVFRALATAGRVFWRPQVVALSAASAIGGHVIFAALGADRGFFSVPPATMVILTIVVISQAWIALCISATALAVTRAEGQAPGIVWVRATTAFEAGLVSLALALPTLACLLFLIVPGIVLALRWSQSMMLILDGRTAWFESAGESALLTHGRRLDILLLWSLLAALFVGVAGVQVYAPAVIDSILLFGANAFALTVLAVLYAHLSEPF